MLRPLLSLPSTKLLPAQRAGVSLIRRQFTVLAVESSADDTCAAVVRSDGQILSNVVIKQFDLHERYGGIHPVAAIEGHQRNMPLAVQRAIREAQVDIVKDISGIAFTRGPGIGGCLSVGSNAAKTLAAALNKPLVGVHHMQAHALTPLLTTLNSPDTPKFPFLTLLVSGGHTLLLLAASHKDFRILATTVDESIGRSFDKVSRMLQLPWSKFGPGAALEDFCAQNGSGSGPNEDVAHIPAAPTPMRKKLSFSYAALHSFVERYIHSQGGIDNLSIPQRRALGRSFQTGAAAQLEEKLLLALEWCEKKNIVVEHVVMSGGVASNQFIRRTLQAALAIYGGENGHTINLIYPPPSLCTDNAVMIAWASMTRFLELTQ
ncbi:hypothetical protein AX16_006934 [Volvariella volvacea WC 439]|nr:hypothetical protein AX16_006934 [Volvariella volvacea WC 439]